MIKILVVYLLFVNLSFQSIINDFNQQLDQLKANSQLKAIQLEVTKKGQIIYHYNIGQKNQIGDSVDNNTVVRIASLSKSFATVAFMKLVQENKIKLNSTISEGLGFQVINPNYPNVPITFEMILSHQSSIIDCDPGYISFLYATRSAKSGSKVPDIKQLLHSNGTYYNQCIFSNKQPGTYFEYSNFCYGIIGTVVQKLSGQRFDIFTREKILKYLVTNQTQIPTFAPWTLNKFDNLAVIYEGKNGTWIPRCDYYSDGFIPEPNYKDYKIGSNGLLFSPQAGLRASVTHLNNYMYFLANEGLTKEGIRILKPQSVVEILKLRYQFHGLVGGQVRDYQNYGLGISKTSLLPVDRVIEHEAVKGHTGDDCGLLSGYYFWKDYTFSYYYLGAMKGYTMDQNSIYEKQRQYLYKIITKYYNLIGAEDKDEF